MGHFPVAAAVRRLMSGSLREADGWPPGPRLPAVIQTLLFGFRPIDTITRWKRRYGGLFTVRIFPIGQFVYVTDPALAREVLTGDPAIFHAGEANRILEPVDGPRSVVVLDEGPHMRARRLMLDLFRKERLANYEALIEQVASKHLEGWPRGRPIAMRPLMRALTLEVMLAAAFGIESQAIEKLKPMLPRLLVLNTRTWIPGLKRDWGPFTPAGQMLRLRERIDDLLYTEIQRRRSDPTHGLRGDMLSQLLAAVDEDGKQLADEEIRDHLATLFLAGHETTSTMLSWAFERLARHPDVVSRVRTSLADGHDSYLDAVVRELLRSRAAVMDTGRTLTSAAELGGWRLPAGTHIRASIVLVHHNAALFPAPHQLLPERFSREERPSTGWIPFGGGVRRCVGASLAMLEMRVVLRTVLPQVSLRPAGNRAEREMFPSPRLTLGPSRGGRVIIERLADVSRQATSQPIPRDAPAPR